jgi:hypothetical protein
MSGCISTIDATAGQVDDDVASIDLALPTAEGRAIPANHAPWPNLGTTAQDDHVMAVAMKRAGKNRPNLSRSSWNDNLHTPSSVHSTTRHGHPEGEALAGLNNS